MSEDPELRHRNLIWLLMHTVYGVPVATIAKRDDFSGRTVRLGIADARGYGPQSAREALGCRGAHAG